MRGVAAAADMEYAPASIFESRRRLASESEAVKRHRPARAETGPAPRPPGARLGHRPPDHGAARPARETLDAARGVGAARASAELPRPPGPLRRHVLERPRPAVG